MIFPKGFYPTGLYPVGLFPAEARPLVLDLSGSVILPDEWDFSGSILVED